MKRSKRMGTKSFTPLFECFERQLSESGNADADDQLNWSTPEQRERLATPSVGANTNRLSMASAFPVPAAAEWHDYYLLIRPRNANCRGLIFDSTDPVITLRLLVSHYSFIYYAGEEKKGGYFFLVTIVMDSMAENKVCEMFASSSIKRRT